MVAVIRAAAKGTFLFSVGAAVAPFEAGPGDGPPGGVTFGRHIKTEVYMSRLQARIRKKCFDQSVGHEPHMLFKGSKMQQSMAGKGTMKIPNRD